MSIPKKDKDTIKKLAREGKQISKISSEDFPEYEYWDIYTVVNDSGGISAQGARAIITNRLNQMISTRRKSEREEIIEEIDDLVWHLYEGLKASQKKLNAIRNVLDK